MFPSPPAKIPDIFGLMPLFCLCADLVSIVTATHVTAKIILYFQDCVVSLQDNTYKEKKKN